MEISQKNKVLKRQSKAIKSVNDELIKQYDHISFQRDEIKQKNELITSSINYARRIQEAVLPSLIKIKKTLKDLKAIPNKKPGLFHEIRKVLRNIYLGVIMNKKFNIGRIKLHLQELYFY